MERLTAPIRDSRSGPGAPPPAGSEATEDGGQGYEDDKSVSELSDDPPQAALVGPSSGPPTASSQSCCADEPRRGTRREVSLDVRLTVADRDAIRRRAHVLGVKPSAWGRAVMLDALDAASRVGQLENMHQASVATPQPALATAVEQLRRVGVNLNQALRKAAAVDDVLLREVMAAVDEVRASLGDRTRT